MYIQSNHRIGVYLLKKYLPLLYVVVGVLIGSIIAVQLTTSKAPLLDDEHDGPLYNDVPKSSSSASSKPESKSISESSRSSSSSVYELPRENTFRNGVWGDSLETVQKYETANDFEFINMDDGTVSYGGYTIVNGRTNTGVVYRFKNNKLFQGGYVFDTTGVRGGSVINEYYSLQEDLSTLYGKPSKAEIVPLVEQRLIDYAGPSDALKFGYVGYISEWTTDDTAIGMVLSSKNYTFSLIINYIDINYQEDLTKSGL